MWINSSSSLLNIKLVISYLNYKLVTHHQFIIFSSYDREIRGLKMFFILFFINIIILLDVFQNFIMQLQNNILLDVFAICHVVFWIIWFHFIQLRLMSQWLLLDVSSLCAWTRYEYAFIRYRYIVTYILWIMCNHVRCYSPWVIAYKKLCQVANKLTLCVFIWWIWSLESQYVIFELDYQTVVN